MQTFAYDDILPGLELGVQEGRQKLPRLDLKIRGHRGNLLGHQGKNDSWSFCTLKLIKAKPHFTTLIIDNKKHNQNYPKFI